MLPHTARHCGHLGIAVIAASFGMARAHRHMDRLARHLPPDYLAQAATALWARRARVLITNGFYVNGHPETDGPPGVLPLPLMNGHHAASNG